MEFWILCFLIFTFSGIRRRNAIAVAVDTSTCNFPAIFNFGDSNSDTGGGSAVFKAVPPPNGVTFFHDPSGRACDGRLIIDFIAEHLGLPYLTPYLDSLRADFRKGANFAVGGASVKKPGYNPIHLGLQISQFQQFKARSIARHRQPQETNSTCKTSTPEPDSFSKALYTFDIGQNDLSHGFQISSESQVNASIPELLDLFSTAIEALYREGARVFWIHNTGPIGCLPYSVIEYPSKSGNLDQNGCVKLQNEIAREFNSQLKDKLVYLGNQFPDSTFTYVDVYSAKYALISGAKQRGFTDPMKFCCGSYIGYRVGCGEKVIVNGTVYGNSCSNPSGHISWDGIHYSEAANHWVVRQIINGSLSEPPIAVDQSCHKKVKV